MCDVKVSTAFILIQGFVQFVTYQQCVYKTHLIPFKVLSDSFSVCKVNSFTTLQKSQIKNSDYEI